MSIWSAINPFVLSGIKWNLDRQWYEVMDRFNKTLFPKVCVNTWTLVLGTLLSTLMFVVLQRIMLNVISNPQTHKNVSDHEKYW